MLEPFSNGRTNRSATEGGMINNLAVLSEYQDWLNAIKQRVVSARLRVALAANGMQAAQQEMRDPPFGQQPVDQIPRGHNILISSKCQNKEEAGFYFVQIIDYIDLLFYHVTLKCNVVVELKNRKFIPEYADKLKLQAILIVYSLLIRLWKYEGVLHQHRGGI